MKQRALAALKIVGELGVADCQSVARRLGETNGKTGSLLQWLARSRRLDKGGELKGKRIKVLYTLTELGMEELEKSSEPPAP